MKRIILSVFTLGLVLASCNKEEVVTVSETETIEQNQSNAEDDGYAFSKELTILDESGEIETKFLVSAESEEFYSAFMESNELVVEYITNDISVNSENETTSDIDQNRESVKPQIEFELLDNEYTLTKGTSVKLSFTQSLPQTKAYTPNPINAIGFSSPNNYATVTNSGPWELRAYFGFKIKWYSPWREHHEKHYYANTSSTEFCGNYHKSRVIIYPDLFAGQTIYFSVTW